ncbi:MAG: hypothetical protein LBM98_10190 [Oscillospiraceae bacterium]|nr:hypothetical protein [Oscillospiraceae bacterium]
MLRRYTYYVSQAFRGSQRRRTAPGRWTRRDVGRGRAGLKPAPTSKPSKAPLFRGGEPPQRRGVSRAERDVP